MVLGILAGWLSPGRLELQIISTIFLRRSNAYWFRWYSALVFHCQRRSQAVGRAGIQGDHLLQIVTTWLWCGLLAVNFVTGVSIRLLTSAVGTEVSRPVT
jgi:hypothetical protein